VSVNALLDAAAVLPLRRLHDRVECRLRLPLAVEK
jgi:hypothetical protein